MYVYIYIYIYISIGRRISSYAAQSVTDTSWANYFLSFWPVMKLGLSITLLRASTWSICMHTHIRTSIRIKYAYIYIYIYTRYMHLCTFFRLSTVCFAMLSSLLRCAMWSRMCAYTYTYKHTHKIRIYIYIYILDICIYAPFSGFLQSVWRCLAPCWGVPCLDLSHPMLTDVLKVLI
jgi:hypothetical protein